RTPPVKPPEIVSPVCVSTTDAPADTLDTGKEVPSAWPALSVPLSAKVPSLASEPETFCATAPLKKPDGELGMFRVAPNLPAVAIPPETEKRKVALERPKLFRVRPAVIAAETVTLKSPLMPIVNAGNDGVVKGAPL